MLKCNEDFHSDHDYCSLIESEKPTTGIQRNIEIRKCEITGLNILIPEFYNIGFTVIPNKFINNFNSPTNNIYILNSSLLI